MLRLLLFCHLVILCSSGITQTLQATYTVQTDMFTEDNNQHKKIAVLEYTGFLYRKEDKYIFFQKPLYLNKYPDGNIRINTGVNQYSNIEVFMDTIQQINYKSMDSAIYRYRFDVTGKNEVTYNLVQSFEPDFQQWQLLPDTKEISGLRCQKARLRGGADSILQWEAWFCSDIPMLAGIANIFNLPGLVVEAECFPVHTRYQLTSYSTTTSISDAIFWPAEFNQPFITRRPIKKNSVSQPSKLQKLNDIKNQ